MYGYGLIRYADAPGPGGAPFPTGGWGWVLSPVVDGIPRIGFAEQPEQFLQPWFEIPDGRHYVVLSVDRTVQAAVGYVDGVEVTRYDNLDPNWAFTTPPGRDHARFLLFTGENDSTLQTWMPAPMGTGIDAVRVQRKALTASEVSENWENIRQGISAPPVSESVQAVLVTSASEVLVDECLVLDGSGSAPGVGATIVKWEWKIGEGPYEEGGSRKEVSFSSTDPPQVAVALRVTNSRGQSSSASAGVKVKAQPVVARLTVKLGDLDVTASEILVATGAVLALDGTASASVVPPGALRCPTSAGDPLAPLPIVAYDWDLDGDDVVDDTRAAFETPPLATPGETTITLAARNSAGSEGKASVKLRVADPGENALVFHDTPDTVFHLEFNEVDLGPVPADTFIDDLSGSGLGLTIVDPVGGSIEAQRGAAHLSEGNVALAYVGGGNGPRGEVRDDGGLFEMDETEDFTFEIYVRPSEFDDPEWGDVAGTFKARTDGTEESARYGWGIIKSHIDDPEKRTQGYMWFVCSGTGGPAEKPAAFQLEKGRYSYVACVVDRTAQTSKVYVDGKLAGEYWQPLDPAWSFETPPGYPPAPFYLFTREQVTGEFSNCPAGVSVDALRLQLAALTPEEIQENWENIALGKGANPPALVRPRFHRGDPNDDGTANITDGIYILNFLFLGGPPPTCDESADANNDGGVNITDGIYVLNFLFLGGPAPPAPGPPEGGPCGEDPDPAGSPGDLGCASYTHC